MSSSFQLRAVIESYGFDAESTFPWEIPKIPGFTWIRLSAEMEQPEIGLFFAQLAAYNRIDLSGNRAAILKELLQAKSLVLAGGIQAMLGTQVISPSCCCGLEGWWEWQNFLETGDTPWLGHNPGPWLERIENVIRIWSDGGSGESMKNAFKIEVTHREFEQALQAVEQDLLGFRFCIESWCESIGFEQARELAEKVEQSFHISPRYL